jgi:GH35 family endo-1,4-beta-xylanase
LAFSEPLQVEDPTFADGLVLWKTTTANGTIEPATVEADGVTTGVRAEATGEGKPWQLQLRQPIDAELRDGDLVTMTFLARSPDSLAIAPALQQHRPPHATAVAGRINAAPDWQRLTHRQTARGDFDAGTLQVAFNLGFGRGTIELTDVQVAVERAAQPPKREEMAPATLEPAVLPTGIGQVPGSEHLNLVSVADDAELVGPQQGSLDVIKTRTPIGSTALRARTQVATAKPWQVGAIYNVRGPVDEGDAMLVVFSARGVEPNPLAAMVRLGMVFELADAPNTKSIEWGMALPVSDEWRTFAVPFRSVTTTAAGKSQVAFRLGYGEQTLDLADVTLINFGPDVDLADLPRTRGYYGGIEDDAPWRAEAAERIEKHRKKDLILRVVDADGKPVSGVTVEAKLVRHAFPFGTAMNERLWPGDDKFSGADGRQYREAAETMFNAGVLENGMKWPVYEMAGKPERAQDVVDWMTERDWYVRGHTLVWPGWRRLPTHLQKLQNDPAALSDAVDEHIVRLMTTFKGEVDAWDVINEPLMNKDLMRILGDEAMDGWMRLARETDPDAKLFINENGFLSNPAADNPTTDYYYDLIRGMQERGVPVDGIGMQGHFTGDLPSMEHVLRTFDRFAELGLRIEITEIDIDAGDKELEAQFLADLMTAAFSHEAVDAVMLWGFWQGRHWKPEAALLNRDFTKRPTAAAWMRQLDEVWTTQAQVVTDPSGQTTFRGFPGIYEVTIMRDGVSFPRQIKLDAEGASMVELN